MMYFNIAKFMKNNILNSGLCLALGMAASFSLSSCEDWTEVESLDIHTPSLEEQNPQLYEDYLKDLNAFKASDHHVLFVSFSNVANPVKQGERLTALPDSVDYISLNNPSEIGAGLLEEMNEVRRKGTKIGYTFSYAQFEAEWDLMLEANPELTETERQEYFTKRTEEMLSLVDKYNYDGVIVDYVGRSLVSLKDEPLRTYIARQKGFFDIISTWKSRHTDKFLVFYGNAQYIAPDNMGFLMNCSHIIVRTELSTGEGDLDVKIQLAEEAGKEVMHQYEGANLVPLDNMIVCVQMPKADDKNKTIGYWGTVESGNKVSAAVGAASWLWKPVTTYTRRGLLIMNVESDYYSTNYSFLKNVINIMNPNK